MKQHRYTPECLLSQSQILLTAFSDQIDTPICRKLLFADAGIRRYGSRFE